MEKLDLNELECVAGGNYDSYEDRLPGQGARGGYRGGSSGRGNRRGGFKGRKTR